MFFLFIRAKNCHFILMFITALIQRLQNFLRSVIREFENDPIYIKPSFYSTDKDLPVDHFAMDRAQMQVHSYLFSLCDRSIKKTWCTQRVMAYHKKNCKMSSLGWQRL